VLEEVNHLDGGDIIGISFEDFLVDVCGFKFDL
jgi:hypothetical protein